jgi:hypothetical protein
MVKLLRWLRFRHFRNTLDHLLSDRKRRFGFVAYVLMMTVFAMITISMFMDIGQVDYVSPVYREFFTLAIFLFIAFAAAVTTTATLTLRAHEEDILLTLPTENSSIVQSRLIVTLLIAPFLALLITCILLGAEHLITGTDFLARFPFAYLSVLLFTLICLGLFFVIAGVWKKYERFFSGMEIVGAVCLCLILAAVVVLMVSYGMSIFEMMYFHPVTRFLLVVPFSSVYVYTSGGFDLITLYQIVILAGLATLFLYKAFHFNYELSESHVSPYQRTIGRGAERESPPLPSVLERIRSAFHIRYLDAGKGAKAVFGFSYQLSLRSVFMFGYVVIFGAWWLVMFTQSDRYFMVMSHFVFQVPMVMLCSWMLGLLIGVLVTVQLNVDILRAVPVRGKKVLDNMILPAPLLLGLCYFPIIVMGMLFSDVNLILFLFEGFILAPVLFVSGYVSFMSMVVRSGPMKTVQTPEGVQTANPTTMILLMLAPAMMLFIYYFLIIFTGLFVVAVLVVFLIVTMSMVLAYALYEGSARNLDGLRPKVQKG